MGSSSYSSPHSSSSHKVHRGKRSAEPEPAKYGHSTSSYNCETVYETVYEKHCETKYVTEYQKKCNTEYKEVCHQESSYGHHGSYKPKSKCEHVPVEKCEYVPKKECHRVPKDECKHVSKQVPKEECRQVPKKVAKKVCSHNAPKHHY